MKQRKLSFFGNSLAVSEDVAQPRTWGGRREGAGRPSWLPRKEVRIFKDLIKHFEARLEHARGNKSSQGRVHTLPVILQEGLMKLADFIIDEKRKFLRDEFGAVTESYETIINELQYGQKTLKLIITKTHSCSEGHSCTRLDKCGITYIDNFPGEKPQTVQEKLDGYFDMPGKTKGKDCTECAEKGLQSTSTCIVACDTLPAITVLATDFDGTDGGYIVAAKVQMPILPEIIRIANTDYLQDVFFQDENGGHFFTCTRALYPSRGIYEFSDTSNGGIAERLASNAEESLTGHDDFGSVAFYARKDLLEKTASKLEDATEYPEWK